MNVNLFDLEKSIADWRKQMLSAGIKTPVPLEELEIHLREEIERQTRSGLDEQEIFIVAAKKIGQGKMLRKEFKKVEYGHEARRVLRLIGWLAAGVVLPIGWIRFDFDWSLFSFYPDLRFGTIEDIAIIVAAETAIWFLAKVNHDLPSRIVSLIICLFLGLVAAGYCYHAAQPGRGIFGGIREPDPLWYRTSMTSLLFLPCGFWIWWVRRHKIQRRDSIRESRTVYSS